MIIPKHHFGEYNGAKSREAPANLKPVGTGPYKFVEFKPGDILRASATPTITSRTSRISTRSRSRAAATRSRRRAPCCRPANTTMPGTLLVEDEVLKRMETGGRGKISAAPSGDIEFIILNTTDPWTEVDGERSSVKTKHPTLSDPAVRQAINLLIDRELDPEIHLWPRRHRDGELRQRAQAVQVAEAEIRVQRRQGEQDPRRRRLEEGRRRHPREGRQEAQIRLPDLDQRPAPEDPGHHQAGLPARRHRSSS